MAAHRREAQVRLVRPAQEFAVQDGALALKEQAQGADRLGEVRHRALLRNADPFQKLRGASGDAQIEAPVGEFIERGGEHGDLGDVQRVWVQDARADLDALGRGGYRGEDHGRGAQK